MSEPPEKVPSREGTLAFVALDPGDGRWLWSLTWKGTSDRWDENGNAVIPGVRKVERHGKEATRDLAIDALSRAASQGRPDA